MRAGGFAVLGVAVLLSVSCSSGPTCSSGPGGAATLDDEWVAARLFEQARRTEPELISFIRRMPKGADLHNHVSGAIYSDFMLDHALERGFAFDPRTAKFVSPETEGAVPVADLLRSQNDELLDLFLDEVSMRGWRSGESGHDHFFDAFPVISSAYAERDYVDVLAEVIERNVAQRVHHLELMARWRPREAVAKFGAGVNVDDGLGVAWAVLEPRIPALSRAIDEHLDDLEGRLGVRLGWRAPLSDDEGPVTVRFIGSVNRLGSDTSFFIRAAAILVAVRDDPRVVALNMVAPEDHPNARRNFDRQMQILDFLWQRLGEPAITLHAGELTLEVSPFESMQSRIRDSIEIGHARRIGHGVSIAWEDDSPALLKKMRDEGVLVEICLTSNASILGVEGARHPFQLYRDSGVPVAIATDDEGVSRIVLTSELVRATQAWSLSYHDLKRMAYASIEHSFLDSAAKAAALARLAVAYRTFEAELSAASGQGL